MPDAISRLSELSDDELDALIDIAQARAEGALTRRDLLKMGGGLAAAGVLGGSAVDSVSADASTSDGDWNLGEPGNRGDVFADGVNATSVDADESNNTIICAPSDDPQAKFDEAATDGKKLHLTAGTHELSSSITIPDTADKFVITTDGFRTEISANGDYPIFDLNGIESDNVTFGAIRGYPILNGGGKSNTSAHGIDAEFCYHLQLEIGHALNCRDVITLKDVWQCGIDADIDAGSATAGTEGNHRGLVTRDPTASDPANTALEIDRLMIRGAESWGIRAPHVSGTKASMIEVSDCGNGIYMGDPGSTLKYQFFHAGIILVDSIPGTESIKISGANASEGNLNRIGHLWTGNVPQGPELVDMQYMDIGNIMSVDADSHGLILDGVRESNISSVIIRDASLSGPGNASAIRHNATNRGTGGVTIDSGRIVGGSHQYAIDEQGGAAVASKNRYGSALELEGGGGVNLSTGTVFSGETQEFTSAEQPQRPDLQAGDIVDFEDTGDGSGTGVYIRLRDGSYTQIG